MSNLFKYNDGEVEVSISIVADTIWLTQKLIVELEVYKQRDVITQEQF